mgnify:CR=1 FL=1
MADLIHLRASMSFSDDELLALDSILSVVRRGGDARMIARQPAAVRVGWGQLLLDKNWQNNPLRVGSLPRTTFSATEPRNTCRNPVRPWVPRTTRS